MPEEAIELMLTAIEEMKYFLCMAYGDSKGCTGSQIEVNFQWICQENEAAPAGWVVISIIILTTHNEKGQGAHFISPINNLSGHIADILFVNDMDIIHVDLRED